MQADQAGDASGSRWLVFEGDSGNPQAWESLLKAVGRVEHFGVLLNHADKLRLDVDAMACGAGERHGTTKGAFDPRR